MKSCNYAYIDNKTNNTIINYNNYVDNNDCNTQNITNTNNKKQ